MQGEMGTGKVKVSETKSKQEIFSEIQQRHFPSPVLCSQMLCH